ncbi:hypothetical protein [uncultured Maritimibacter sp.]|jgi:hypothetical protein|uniref:hypothetical protein n=1 Tax=uncultured Maritimibacter sp. TaxID=991866 RepID=UPI0026397544|nr:hypothetical protein [uncultured Maritimibacter sp.]
MGQTTDTTPETAASFGTKGPAAGHPSAAPVTELRFDLLRSATYHDLCQRNLARLHRFLQFLTVLLGSAAIAAFGSQFPIFGQAAGIAVAAIAAAQLVWDFGGLARTHGDLRRRFFTLLSEHEGGAPDADVMARLTMIYADEPPVIRRLNRRAHNHAGMTLYGDDFTKA